MSEIWAEKDYNDVLAFVEKQLWLFVQENAGIHRPRQVVSNLAQLSYNDLRLLQTVYFLLSKSVQSCIRDSVPYLLRRLTQSSARVIAEFKGGVRGNVDWERTLRRRWSSCGNDPTVFVTRVAIKSYNLPEVQALKFLLTLVNRLSSELLGSIPEERESLPYSPGGKWKDNVRSLYHLTNTFLQNVCLRDVSLPAKVDDLMMQRVRCARNMHFKNLYEALLLYRKLFVQEDHATLRKCFEEGVLRPLNEDTLYEIYILFLTIASLEQVGWNREHLRLIGYGKGAVAHYGYGGKKVRLYYQTLPAGFSGSSLYTDLLRKYGIDVSLRRPDILFEFEGNGRSFKLLEIKRTQDKKYIADSVYKVLGYLKDFGKCFEGSPLPHGILVVWEGVETVDSQTDVLVLLNRQNYQRFLENRVIAIDPDQ
jgi:hypothetical protein